MIISFLSLLIHFFFPINKFVSILALIIGILLFFKNIKFYKTKKVIIFYFLSTLVTLITFLYSQHPIDSEMYHHPYVSYLNKEKIILGAANLQFRFGHVSLLQYFQAITINNNLSIHNISFANIFFFTAFVVFAIKKLFQNNKLDFLKIIILSLLFITLIKFGRYREWGNDLIPLIVCFYFLIKFLESKFFVQKKLLINLTPLLFVFLLVHKISYIFAPLFFIYFFKESFFFKELFNLRYLWFSFIFATLWLFKTFIVSSCLVYPVIATCISNDLIVAGGLADPIKANWLTELWSKSFIDHPDWRNLNLNLYMQNFNWVPNWLSSHFYKILEKTSSIFILFLILFIYSFLFKKKLVKIEKQKLYYKKIKFLIFVILIGLFIWFIKAPLFRYGAFYVVGFLVILFTLIYSKIFENKIFPKSRLHIFLVIFSLIFFVSKNILRMINSENPLFPKTLNKDVILLKEKHSLKLFKVNRGVCHYTGLVCSHETPQNININLFYSYKNVKN